MKKALLLSLFSILSVISVNSFAVTPLFEDTVKDPNAPQGFVEKFLADMGASDTYDSSKDIDFSVLPGPFYTPEMEVGLGLSAVGLYQIGDEKGTDHQPSNITINAFLSSNLSAGITVNSTTLLHGGLHRFEFTGELSNSPDIYYGVGYDAGQRNQNEVDYTRKVLQVTPKYYFRIRPNLYFATGFDYKNTRVHNPEPEEDGNPAADDLTGNQEAGFLLNLTYDSRDFLLNASEGWLMQLDYARYIEAIADHDFSTYKFNLANYVDLSPMPGLIAWQVKGSFTGGDVPWTYMPLVGGGSNLRGYLEGRYRDRQVGYSQIEYRLPIKDRHGMVTWVGTSTLGNKLHDLGDDFLMSYGVGYRFRIKDRVNLRLDYAIGEHDSTVYFNVNEAF